MMDAQEFAKKLEDRINNKLKEVYSYPKTEYAEGYVNACKAVLKVIQELEKENLTPESAQNVPNQAFKMQKSDVLGDKISRQAAIDAINNIMPTKEGFYEPSDVFCELMQLPSAHQTLYGYDIEHLKLIANILQKENLPPERVADALMDIGRIVVIVGDEYRETLRKAVEQCRI